MSARDRLLTRMTEWSADLNTGIGSDVRMLLDVIADLQGEVHALTPPTDLPTDLPPERTVEQFVDDVLDGWHADGVDEIADDARDGGGWRKLAASAVESVLMPRDQDGHPDPSGRPARVAGPPADLPTPLASVDDVAAVDRAVALVLAQHLGWVADVSVGVGLDGGRRDDRDRVVKGWRSIGLTVMQVADGNF